MVNPEILGNLTKDLTWSSCGQLFGKIPKNFWVDHDRSSESDSFSVTMAVIVRHCPPGRCNLNLHVPTIFILAFWASDSLYLSELGSIVAPICFAIFSFITSHVAPVSGVTRSVATLAPLSWQLAIIFRATNGVGAPNPRIPG